MQPSHQPPPSLVFLHYFGGSSHAWDGVIARLGEGLDCVAQDLRGFGSARSAPGPYTLDAYANDVEDLVARLGLERVILVGHSMGGKIALSLAGRRPAWLDALVLVAPSPPTPEPMSETDRADLLAGYGDRAAASATARKITARPLASAVFDQVVDDMLRTAEPAWTAWLRQGSREDISAEIGRLSVPTLVMSGGDDRAIPRQVLESEVMPRLSHGRLVSVAGAGHLLPLEATDEVAGLVQDVARAVARSPETPAAPGASS